MQVKEAGEGDRVLPGRILIAPGSFKHMKLVPVAGGEYRVTLADGAPVNFSRPSVDVLFEIGRPACGGQRSRRAPHRHGQGWRRRALGHPPGWRPRTFAQDEATSVVFGMPRAAQALDAAELMLPLGKIPAALVTAVQSIRAAGGGGTVNRAANHRGTA